MPALCAILKPLGKLVGGQAIPADPVHLVEQWVRFDSALGFEEGMYLFCLDVS